MSHRKYIKIYILLLFAAVFALLMIANCNVTDQSTYQVLAKNGYKGTREQWLASLVGEEASANTEQSAYELAVINGYTGSERDWIMLHTGTTAENTGKGMYSIAREAGYAGSFGEWLTSISGEQETLGRSDGSGEKTEYELACDYGFEGSFVEWLIAISSEKVFQ